MATGAFLGIPTLVSKSHSRESFNFHRCPRLVPPSLHAKKNSKVWPSRARYRHFYSSARASQSANTHGAQKPTINAIYHGPLTATFRNLKIFSLSSFGLASAITPFMFVIESSLPLVARVALAATAMMTSGVSTGLVAWCGRPYVASLRLLGPDDGEGATGIRMETTTLMLRPRFTTVYDTTFLAETRRPFAKWELAESVRLQASVHAGGEETVAETTDAGGKVIGRWIVRWAEDGVTGTCREVGKVVRYVSS